MGKNKLNIAFDFDNTMCNSNLAIVELFKINHPEIISTNYPRYEFVTEWNYQDVLPDITNEEVEKYFNDHRLFDLITFFMDDKTSMKDLISELISEGHNAYIISKGSDVNIALKKSWLKERLPIFNLNNLIGIPLTEVGKPDKYTKHMDILIDDVDSNFNNSVKYKLLFANQGLKSWNRNGLLEDSPLEVVCSVTEAANVIYDIINFERSR